MNFTVRELSVPVTGAFAWAATGKDSLTIRRRRALRRFDKELENGNYKAAHSLLKQLQLKPAALLGFGSANLVPKRLPVMNSQELCGNDSMSLESLADSILRSIKYSIEFGLSDEEILIDEARMEYARGNEDCDSPHEDHQMCLQHEVGHFLVGYLVGVLPRSYHVPSVEDIIQDKFAQGRVRFLGFESLKELTEDLALDRSAWRSRIKVDISTVSSKKDIQGKLKSKENRAKISSQILNRFLCAILGGLVAEHLIFGYSELLSSDVQQLDRVLRWLCFDEDETDSLVRWAVLTTLSLLSRHHEARSRLAEAMSSRRSIGYCIDTIESALCDP